GARKDGTGGILGRLEVAETCELPLAFVFETGGPEADARLAAYLEAEAGYEVWIVQGGVSGRTEPVELSSEALEAWVRAMLGAGRRFGGCAFGGWAVALSRAEAPAPTTAPAKRGMPRPGRRCRTRSTRPQTGRSRRRGPRRSSRARSRRRPRARPRTAAATAAGPGVRSRSGCSSGRPSRGSRSSPG